MKTTIAILACLVFAFVYFANVDRYKPKTTGRIRINDGRAMARMSASAFDNVLNPSLARRNASTRSTKSFGRMFSTNFSGFDVTSADNGPSGKYMVACCKLNKSFLSRVPICAVHAKDFEEYKYWVLRIGLLHPTTKQLKSMYVYCMDMCKDKDCAKKDPNCCTKNAAAYGNPNFVIDLERTSCQKLLGFNPMKYLLSGVAQKVTYIPLETFKKLHKLQ